MFEDHQSDQTHDTDNGTPDASSGSGSVSGVGINPSPTYVPPADSSATPTVVMPSQGTAAGTSDDHSGGPVATSSVSSSSDLEEIKRHALAQLSPLVNQLQQTPEEKYKTIMMMIQASDNQDLLGEAYENAQKISDEKAKAEALLNIVNEINYFTQKSQK